MNDLLETLHNQATMTANSIAADIEARDAYLAWYQNNIHAGITHNSLAAHNPEYRELCDKVDGGHKFFDHTLAPIADNS